MLAPKSDERSVARAAGKPAASGPAAENASADESEV